MVSKTNWWIGMVVAGVYLALPPVWFLSLVGTTVPSSTVTYSTVWVVGVYTLITASIGYALGRSFPEPDPLDFHPNHKDSRKPKR